MNPLTTVLDATTDLADSIFDGIDDLVTTEEEAKRLKTRVQSKMIAFREKALKAATKEQQMRAKVLAAGREEPWWRSARSIIGLGIFVFALAHASGAVDVFSSDQLYRLLIYYLGGMVGLEGVVQGARSYERKRVAEATRDAERHRRATASLQARRSGERPAPKATGTEAQRSEGSTDTPGSTGPMPAPDLPTMDLPDVEPAELPPEMQKPTGKPGG
jgi:hypothetical protein